MGAIEILAWIFVIVIAIKLLVILISPKSWMNFVKAIYKSPAILVIVELILAAIVLYYLIQSLTIVQIVACVLFGALLTGVSFAVYTKELIPPMMRVLKRGALRRAWLPILVWIGLAVWVLIALL